MTMIEEAGTSRAPRPGAAAAARWWRRPWVLPLAVVAIGFVALSLPRYTTLDPRLSGVPAPEAFPWHYPVLVAHVAFGSVAMLTCCLQVWPWLRQRHPAVHRWSGRIYVLAAVLPGGVTGLAVGAISPHGPTVAASNVVLALLWLGVTAIGFRRARQRRFADHRRWMIRSFALTMSIVTNRVTGVAWVLVLLPELSTTYAGSTVAVLRTAAGLAAWTGWMGSLLVAEWWLHRTRRDRRDGRAVSRPARAAREARR